MSRNIVRIRNLMPAGCSSLMSETSISWSKLMKTYALSRKIWNDLQHSTWNLWAAFSWISHSFAVLSRSTFVEFPDR